MTTKPCEVCDIFHEEGLQDHINPATEFIVVNHMPLELCGWHLSHWLVPDNSLRKEPASVDHD